MVKFDSVKQTVRARKVPKAKSDFPLFSDKKFVLAEHEQMILDCVAGQTCSRKIRWQDKDSWAGCWEYVSIISPLCMQTYGAGNKVLSDKCVLYILRKAFHHALNSCFLAVG